MHSSYLRSHYTFCYRAPPRGSVLVSTSACSPKNIRSFFFSCLFCASLSSYLICSFPATRLKSHFRCFTFPFSTYFTAMMSLSFVVFCFVFCTAAFVGTRHHSGENKNESGEKINTRRENGQTYYLVSRAKFANM